MKVQQPGSAVGRIALVDTCRTPFARVGGELANLTTLDLATTVVGELLRRHGLGEDDVSALILGSAMQYPRVAYLAREAAIALGVPDINGYDAEFACATSARTTINGVLEIMAGDADVVIAGGVESMSHVGAPTSEDATQVVNRNRFRDADRFRSLATLPLNKLLPQPAPVAEPYTGKTLGEHAEEIVSEWGVTREEADEFAVASHHGAAAARREGRLGGQIVPVATKDGEVVCEDAFVREDTSLEKVASLPPVFDESGTVTAANASPLSDGGAAVLLASEAACDRMGLTPRAWVRSWSFTGHAPEKGVLMGPARALPRALDRVDLELDDLGVIDIHEAFAGQVLANLKALESDAFAWQVLGRDRAVGTVDRSRLNVNGGSVALGHPFGATGARLLGQVLAEMERRSSQYGALTICAGGTRGAAVVLELA